MANSIPSLGTTSGNQSEPLEISGTSKPDVKATAQTKDGSASVHESSDATEFSNVATVIAASRQAATRPAVRTELVNSLRAQIASGTYRPDPDLVAARVAAGIR